MLRNRMPIEAQLNRTRRLWERLVEPTATVTELREQQQSRVASAVIIPFIVVSVMVLAVIGLGGLVRPIHLLVLVPLVALKLTSYALSRRGHYQAGMALFVGILLGHYLAFTLLIGYEYAHSVTAFVLVAVFVTSLFFSPRVTGAMAAVALLLVGAGMLITGETSLLYMAVTIGLVTYFSEVILFISVIRYETDVLIEQQTEALIEGESRFRSIFDQTFHLASFLRTDGFVIDVNHESAALLQQFGGRAIGLHLWEIDIWQHADYTPEQVRADVQRAVAGETTNREVRFGKGDETQVYDIWLRPVYDDRGQVYLLTFTGKNITALKEAERKRRLEAQRYQMIFEQMSDGLVLVSFDNKIISMNPAGAAMLGYAPEDLEGLDARALLNPGEVREYDEMFSAFMNGEDITHYELVLTHRDGHDLAVDIQPTIVQDTEGEPLYVQTVFRDLTARKRAEQHQFELQQERDRLNLLHAFVADVAHDLRQPLTNIKNSAYLARRAGAASEEKLTHYTTLIDRSADVLEQIIESQLSAVRDETSDDAVSQYRYPMDINSVVRSVVQHLQGGAQQAGSEIRLDLEADLPITLGNNSELGRALAHILNNAIQFTNAGGHICVSTSFDEGHIYMSVADNGIGIHEDDLPYIFNTLYRADNARSQSGAGLGLTIAQKVAEAHEGTLTVESKVGEGSTFTLRLPKIRKGSSVETSNSRQSL